MQNRYLAAGGLHSPDSQNSPRGAAGAPVYRPYVFRPRVRVGFGVFVGYPVPYTYSYGYPIRVVDPPIWPQAREGGAAGRCTWTIYKDPSLVPDEAYLRVAGVEKDQHWNGRGHFFAAAAEAMRRILVEKARRKGRLKRGADVYSLKRRTRASPRSSATTTRSQRTQ